MPVLSSHDDKHPSHTNTKSLSQFLVHAHRCSVTLYTIRKSYNPFCHPCCKSFFRFTFMHSSRYFSAITSNTKIWPTHSVLFPSFSLLIIHIFISFQCSEPFHAPSLTQNKLVNSHTIYNHHYFIFLCTAAQ